MGRIVRIGVNTNYTVEATSNYVEDTPAATTSAWTDPTILDQNVYEPGALSESHQGCLLTFVRFPTVLTSIMAKLVVTYDQSSGENPAIEFWTFDTTNGWRKISRYPMVSIFEGATTGESKIYDVAIYPNLAGCTKIWVTLDPGLVGAPTMAFKSLSVFGLCDTKKKFKSNSSGDPCADPNGPGYDGTDQGDPPQPCIPIPGDTGGDDCPAPDLCDGASIELYRTCLDTYGAGLREQFDAWYQINAQLIQDYCNDSNTDPPTLPPLPGPQPPPVFPPLCDFKDPVKLAAFQATLTATQLATFTTFYNGLIDDGFFELVCPDLPPTEIELDPKTLKPVEISPEPPPRPFGGGPGGDPLDDPDPAPSRAPQDVYESVGEFTQRYIITWSGNDLAAAAAYTDANITPIPATTVNAYRPARILANYGPAIGQTTLGLQHTPAPYALVLKIKRMPFRATIGLRMRTFFQRRTADLRFSISDASIREVPAAGLCPINPDWIITPGPNVELSTGINPVYIGDNYYEYRFNSSLVGNKTAILTLAVPRDTPGQNDIPACIAGTKARSELAGDRGGCIIGFVGKARLIFLNDVSIEDYDSDPTGIYFAKALTTVAMVLDVTVRPDLAGKGVDAANTYTALSSLSAAQTVETCP
jgi:hypothetical protein